MNKMKTTTRVERRKWRCCCSLKLLFELQLRYLADFSGSRGNGNIILVSGAGGCCDGDTAHPDLMILHSSHSNNYTALQQFQIQHNPLCYNYWLPNKWDEEKSPCASVFVCCFECVRVYYQHWTSTWEIRSHVSPSPSDVKSLFIVLVEESSFHIAYQQHQLIVLLSRF